MTYLPTVRDDLSAIAGRLAADRADKAEPQGWAKRITWRQWGLGALLFVAISGPAVAAIRPWEPLLGDDRRGVPAASTDRLPAEQIEGLAVLRGVQDPSDRAFAEKALSMLSRDVSGVRTSFVRVLHGREADAVLVPVRRFNLEASKMIEPDTDSGIRANLEIKSDGLCLFVPEPGGDGGGLGCETWSQITKGRLPSSLGDLRYGLVPDGIAQVTLKIDGRDNTVEVENNFFTYRSSIAPETIVWRNSNGDTVNTVVS